MKQKEVKVDPEVERLKKERIEKKKASVMAQARVKANKFMFSAEDE